jgi:dihydrofolate reductase
MGAATTPNNLSMKNNLNILLSSRERLTCRSFGRKTYQLMVPYWPDVLKDPSATKADTEFAKAFDSTSKIVFSRSLDRAEDQNTRIVRGDLRDEILRLKQERGKNFLVGGVDIPSQLIQLGLVDEYRFMVGPIIAGEGRRLLQGVSLPEKIATKTR